MLVACRSRRHSRQRDVAKAYAVFDTPAICASSYHQHIRVLIVEDEPYMAEAVRDGLRLEAIAADDTLLRRSSYPPVSAPRGLAGQPLLLALTGRA